MLKVRVCVNVWNIMCFYFYANHLVFFKNLHNVPYHCLVACTISYKKKSSVRPSHSVVILYFFPTLSINTEENYERTHMEVRKQNMAVYVC